VPIADSLAGGAQAGRLGSGNANIVPYQVFDCADDSILVAAGNDALYQRLCNAMELPELAHDPRFVTNGQRVTNRKALIALLKARFREAPAHEWLRRLEAVSIPCGPLQSVEAVVTDAQTLSLDILRKTPDQRTTSVALPISFDGVRPPMPGNTPALGQHDHLIAPRGAATLSQETA
jgi:crotonobetainyl-CoA:carnitine CoA-transferase CaiB-like acyl-CoA transferase